MGQPKDYLTAVNLARHTEPVDRTIGDSHSRFQLCNLLCDDLCQENKHDGIEPLRESFCPNLGSRDRNHQSSTQSYRRRYTGGFTPPGPICFKCGVVGRGGGTWVFFGWVCAARDAKLAPRSSKNFP